MPESILITGSYGFIGSHLVPFLARNKFEIHSLVRKVDHFSNLPGFFHACDLKDSSALLKLFDEIRPSYIIHLASRARPGRDLNEFEPQISDTITPAFTLAKNIPESVKLSLFFGSCEEYGNGPTPFIENQNLVSISPYGWAKISAYYAVKMILEKRGISYCWARPFLTFGANQNSDQLIPSVIKGCLNDEAIALSPGMQTRDFLYINDLCEMVLMLIKNPLKVDRQTINLCSSTPRTIRSVAKMIQGLCGRGKLNFGDMPYRNNEAMSFFGSNKKYSSIFGPPNLTSFDEAIQETINSYME